MENGLDGKIVQDFFQNKEINQTELRHLIAGILEISPSDLILHQKKILSKIEISKIKNGIQRLKINEPVYRILGWREFYGRKFFLNSATLEPRADSEILIDTIKDHFPVESSINILELGTGSGCLLLTLLAEFPNAKGLATDVSKQALKCAEKNAEKLSLTSRISFFEDDLLDSKISKKFDIIISNPPYISTSKIKNLDKNVKKFDPILALDGGKTGLKFYKEIAKKYKEWLNPNGKMFLEIGFDQAEDTLVLFPSGKIILDYGKNPRILLV